MTLSGILTAKKHGSAGTSNALIDSLFDHIIILLFQVKKDNWLMLNPMTTSRLPPPGALFQLQENDGGSVALRSEGFMSRASLRRRCRRETDDKMLASEQS